MARTALFANTLVSLPTGLGKVRENHWTDLCRDLASLTPFST